MKAWLVTWDWIGDSAAVADQVAAILNPRWSTDRVVSIVEFLYAKRFSTAAELAAYARYPAHNPYRAQKDFNGYITCGNHPWLHARIVEDLTVTINAETNVETITWTELPIHAPRQQGFPEEVRGPLAMRVSRRITGPLSDELIWDRAQGRFKPGWEP